MRMYMFQMQIFPWHARRHPFLQFQLHEIDGSHHVRSSVHGALHTLIRYHVVRGRVVFPGAGYLELARAVASSAAALHDVFFLLPLAVEAPGLLIECALRAKRFEVRSSESDGTLAAAAVHCSGELAVATVRQHEERSFASGRSPTCAVAVGALYDGFDAVGLQYGPGYRTLARAWTAAGEATARLHPRSTHEGTAVHPADLDDALCVSALVASGGGDNTETQLPFAVDGALLQHRTGELWAVRAALALPSHTLPEQRSALAARACS